MDPKQLRDLIEEVLILYTGASVLRGASVQLLVTAAIATEFRSIVGHNYFGIFGMRWTTFDLLWDTIYDRDCRKRKALFNVCDLPTNIGMAHTIAQYIPQARLMRTNLSLAICTAFERYLSATNVDFPDHTDNGGYDLPAIVRYYRTVWHPTQPPPRKTFEQDYCKMHYNLMDEDIINDDDFQMDLDFSKEDS